MAPGGNILVGLLRSEQRRRIRFRGVFWGPCALRLPPPLDVKKFVLIFTVEKLYAKIWTFCNCTHEMHPSLYVFLNTPLVGFKWNWGPLNIWSFPVSCLIHPIPSIPFPFQSPFLITTKPKLFSFPPLPICSFFIFVLLPSLYPIAVRYPKYWVIAQHALPAALRKRKGTVFLVFLGHSQKCSGENGWFIYIAILISFKYLRNIRLRKSFKFWMPNSIRRQQENLLVLALAKVIQNAGETFR